MSSFIGFFGEFRHKVNEKGRTSVPADFRNTITTHFDKEALVLMEDKDHVRLTPATLWLPIYEKNEQKALEDRKFAELWRYRKRFIRTIYMEENGRILLPASFREKLKLVDECMIIGNGNKIEIWNPEVLDAKHSEDKIALLEEEYDGLY